MKKIRRKISTESYRSRVLGGLPFISGRTIAVGGDSTTNWGEIIADIDFSKFDSADVAKYGSGILSWGKMSYRELMDAYYGIKNRNLEELPEGEATLSEKVEENARVSLVRFVESHILHSVAQYDDPCACPAPREVDEENVEWAANILGKCSVPTINFTLGLTQKINLVGSYTVLAKDWVPGKRYYIGDICRYDNQVYELSDTAPEFSSAVDLLPSTNEETRSLFKTGAKVLYYRSGTLPDGDVSEWVYVELADIDELVAGGYPYAKIGGQYYTRPYWDGATCDGAFEIFFDEVNPDTCSGFINVGSDGSTTHWKLRSDLTFLMNGTIGSDDGKALKISGDGGEFTEDVTKVSGVIEESKLDEFTRRKRSIDDNGSILPGYLMSTGATSLALKYSIGSVANVSSEENAYGEKIYMGDYLEKVVVYDDYTLNTVAFTATSDAEFASSINNFVIGSTGVVEFVYYLGVDIGEDSNGNFVFSGGTANVPKYTDRYSFVVSMSEEYEIDGQSKTFKYMDIDYDSGSDIVVYENLDNLQYPTKLSTVAYSTLSSTETPGKSSNLINSPFFMEDYKLGISFIDNNAGSVMIDRGNAAAFERHLRLSENKTMQDLEQYGNGFFSLKK